MSGGDTGCMRHLLKRLGSKEAVSAGRDEWRGTVKCVVGAARVHDKNTLAPGRLDPCSFPFSSASRAHASSPPVVARLRRV
jgi:hypothetical protein